jgi:hypothetical protein
LDTEKGGTQLGHDFYSYTVGKNESLITDVYNEHKNNEEQSVT